MGAVSKQRIVVGVDGSDASRAALDWAFEEAPRRGALLEVVTAWELPVTAEPIVVPEWPIDLGSLEAAAKQLLDDEIAAATERTGVSLPDVDRVAAFGHPGDVLVERAAGADLLVVGSRGRGGFTGLLLGSVSNRCVHHAPCPVVVVRGQ